MTPLSPSRRRYVVVAAIAAILAAVPIGVLAQSFNDVPTENSYYNDIEALKAKGVTTGCAVGLYCPKDYVTREQMAAFMNRLGALQAGKTPVVNADKLDGLDSTAFLRGSIEIDYFAPWLPVAGSTATFIVYKDAVAIGAGGTTGVRSVALPLTGPSSFGSAGYGLASVEICWIASQNAAIDKAEIVGHGGSVDVTVATKSNVTVGDNTPGCTTVTDASPTTDNINPTLMMDLGYVQSEGSFNVIRVTGTWVKLP